MQAIHVNWSKPRINSAGSFFVEDFDILTTILSALKWREFNGEITMVTDSAGAAYYRSRGMDRIWNNIETTLDDVPEYINTSMFWAAGKLFALKSQKTPVAVMDTDFIVWSRLAFDNFTDLTVIHREELYPDVYPDINCFKMKRGYIFDPDLDWREKPANAAFYVIKNEELKNSYTDEAVRFMENALEGDNLTYMVFAEQRLMAMAAKRMGIEVAALSTTERLFEDGERYFTHTWGMKQQMRDMPKLRYDFCRRCVDRIRNDYPDYTDMLEGIEELRPYL